jgi:hypothetical protein
LISTQVSDGRKAAKPVFNTNFICTAITYVVTPDWVEY